MAKKVILELTPLEASALYQCANNGFGDGDFAQWLRDAGAKGEARVLEKAIEKLRRASTRTDPK